MGSLPVTLAKDFCLKAQVRFSLLIYLLSEMDEITSCLFFSYILNMPICFILSVVSITTISSFSEGIDQLIACQHNPEIIRYPHFFISLNYFNKEQNKVKIYIQFHNS